MFCFFRTFCFNSVGKDLIFASTRVRPFSDFYKVPVVSNRLTPKSKPVQPKFGKQLRHRVSDYLKQMATPEIQAKLEPLRAAVKECGDLVRQLKLDNAPQNEVDRAVFELKARKKKLEDMELELAPKDAKFERSKLEDLLKRRFFYDQSFAIYGGVAGLYDYGPMGCALKSNMIQLWRKHFILEENMLEVECSALTPENVLKASGHVDRFIDWMVKDVKTGECFRADHFIKNHAEALLKNAKTSADVKNEINDILARLDGYSNKEMDDVIRKFNLKSPITGNDVTEAVSFNLMFPTQIGPTGDFRAYLRPETAQGIFINFKRLLEFNQGKLPFAAAQIGAGFRNEISPRQGLIRVREFTMCEIEHFVDPLDKAHQKFSKVADLELTLFSACNQMDGKGTVRMRIGDAVAQGIVDNETLGYYMARCHLYMILVGVDPNRLRFRQHMSNEMAHYAKDCWDAEVLTSYGWIECVGNADRACYDLDQHYKMTNVKLVAEKTLSQPKIVQVTEAVPNKALIGKLFKSDGKQIMARLQELNKEEVEVLEKALKEKGTFDMAINDKIFELKPELVEIKRYEKTVHVDEIVPSVIEPSYGIGRILYAVLEHSFRQREGDEQRTFLELKPNVAPIKCSVLPISVDEKLAQIVDAVREELVSHELSLKVDDSSGSIGRRYARTDEIGIPFGITVDFESVKNIDVTLRYAATMQQVRMKVTDVGKTVEALVKGTITWDEVMKKFPIFQAKSEAN